MAQGGDGKIFYMCDSENEECEAECGPGKPSPDINMEEDYRMKPSSSLQMILSSISQARSRECTFVSRDTDFVVVQADNFWVQLFSKHFLEAPEDTNKDDLLFYVRKTMTKSRLNIPQTEIEVYRKSSSSQPSVTDRQIDWEETVYLNLILQHLEYYVTCAICSRTGEKELQILKKFSQSLRLPSRRRMDSKGTQEEIVYPNIFFTVDNFEEAFADIVVRDSEMVCVELVAQDRHAAFQGVIFLGSIRYEALKKIYDARASLTHRMAQRMSLSWFKGHKRVEFVRMRGPLGKGHAEMAVSRQKGSGPETPDQTPNTEKFFMEDFENQGAEEAFTHRRMSDPNVSWHNFGSRASFKRSSIRKTCSETENVNAIGTSNCEEVEADSIEDAFDENIENGFFGKSFGQAWHWFKEKRRSNSVALHAYLTYVTLPWHRIIADVLEMRQEPVLSF